MRPVIGINCEWRERKRYSSQLYLNINYLESIIKAGGTPLVLPIVEQPELFDFYLSQIQGLLLIGGMDINAKIYGEENIPVTKPMGERRLNFDLKLARRATELRLPILAICLGNQIINVALGGDLYQDITVQLPDSNIRHRKKAGYAVTSHKVRVEKDSMLYSIVGKAEIETNSSHHQSIRRVAKDLRPVAFAEDGVVEAVEAKNRCDSFILGVQWHPEYLTDKEEHLALFRALVNAAAKS